MSTKPNPIPRASLADVIVAALERRLDARREELEREAQRVRDQHESK